MKKLLIAALVVLGGCAGNSAFIRQSPIVDDKGVKTYLLSNEISVYDENSTSLVNGYTERANQLCPNGYSVINKEMRKVTNTFGMYVGGKEVTWQIKCKDAS